ncbi:MAG: TM2 domain-containing protein [Cellvibrionaceae bacterium]
MLNQQEVDAEEERLREMAGKLPDDKRKAFYREASRQLRDPDTYATLNWFFLVGLHHFYLGRWQRGLVDLGAFLLGLFLLFAQQYLLGSLLIGIVAIVELWALFHAQIIVQDWNNGIYQRLLEQQGRR